MLPPAERTMAKLVQKVIARRKEDEGLTSSQRADRDHQMAIDHVNKRFHSTPAEPPVERELTVQLPEALADRLEPIAAEEGTTWNALIRRFLAEQVERRETRAAHRVAPRRDVSFPLITKEETGPIQPVTGSELDEIFALDAFNFHSRKPAAGTAFPPRDS